jgi:hypothetical protein
MTRKRLFKQSRFLVFAITLVCIFALVGTAGDLSKEKVVKSQDRMIELADSSVRIMLKGNESYRISLDGKSFSRELPQRNFIRLRGHVFDPLVNPPRAMTAQAPGGRDLYIVQCVTQAIEAFQKQITAIGGEICGTMPDHALIVEMSYQTSRDVKGMSFVRWVGVYQSSFKLVGLEDNASRVMSTGKTHYSLWMTKKTKKKELADFITDIGGEVVLKTKGRRMEAKLDQGQLQQVAARPQVLAIDLWTPKEEDMNNARDIGGADYIETVQGYSGQGVRAEVCDGGLRTTHVDFQANPPLINAGNSSSTSHGTPVTGIVFGDGTGNSDARGMIPNAEQPIFSCYNCFSDRYAHTQSVIALEGVFQTNSWGNTRTFFYTTISAEMDEIIFDLDIIITQSQSNAGNQDSRPQAWAKNIVSVGGLRHYDTLSRSDDCWCTSASIGPAEDGRIKPDIWHFYDYTIAPYYTSDTSYTQFGGTSGATPITAGHMGLIFQMWADGVFEGGPGLARDVFLNKPHFTTAKALLIHSAYQYPFSGTSHDKTRMHQGWGMADVGNLYDMAEAANWSFPVLIDESAVINPLETHTYTVDFDGTKPLRATLVYADPPGTPGIQPNRINDLSLKVTGPGGTFWGNNGLDVGVWSTSGGSSNTIDTVENVFIETPVAGTWTIQVLADEVVQDGHVETGAIDADYALIVSGGSSGPPPIPPADPTSLTANAVSCDQIDLGWTDNSDNETSFKIERSTDGVNFSEIDTVGADITAYSDTTVAESTTYWYRVRASNAGGDSGYTNIASATTPACPINPPAAPTNLTANAVACDQIDLGWTDNSDNETSFKIERSTDGVNFSQIDTVGANVTAYSDTTVAESTTYWYRVRASNGDGDSAYTNIASATTPACPSNPPAAPSNLKAKVKGKSKITLSWNDNSNNEDGFRIYRGDSPSTLAILTTVGANVTSFNDTTVQSKTTYYYKVCAYNGDGEACSGTVSVTTK